MKTYTVTIDGEIAAHATREAAGTIEGGSIFTTRKELEKVVTEWTGPQLVQLWNSLGAGHGLDDLKPVNKFKDRTTAIDRIWNAVRHLEAPGPPKTAAGETAGVRPVPVPQTVEVAGGEAATSEPAVNTAELVLPEPTTQQVEPVVTEPAPKPEPVQEPAATEETKPSSLRPGSKGAIILDLIRRPEGATIDEISAATEWQRHSVRGFISGTLVKKSTKLDDGRRVYRVVR